MLQGLLQWAVSVFASLISWNLPFRLGKQTQSRLNVSSHPPAFHLIHTGAHYLSKCTSPEATAYVWGLSKRSKTKPCELCRGRQTVRHHQTPPPAQAVGVTLTIWGPAYARWVPQELRSNARRFLSVCRRRRRLIASHHSPFAPPLIQSSTSLYALSEGKWMHWLNTSAHAAGTEEIIRHIKQALWEGGKKTSIHCFAALQIFLCSWNNVTPQCWWIFEKAEGFWTTAWGRRNKQGMSMCWRVDDFSCWAALQDRLRWIICFNFAEFLNSSVSYVQYLDHLGSLIRRTLEFEGIFFSKISTLLWKSISSNVSSAAMLSIYLEYTLPHPW